MRKLCIVLLMVVQTKPNWCLRGCGYERFRANGHLWDHGFLFLVLTGCGLHCLSFSLYYHKQTAWFCFVFNYFNFTCTVYVLWETISVASDNWKPTKCVFCKTVPTKPWLRRSLTSRYIKILGTTSSLKNHSWKSGVFASIGICFFSVAYAVLG